MRPELSHRLADQRCRVGYPGRPSHYRLHAPAPPPLLALAYTLAAVGPAAAADRTETAPSLVALSDAELAARLGFLEERLDAGRPTALAWHWGWTGFYSASLALNVGYAIEAEDGDDRVRAIVDATKSGVAT